MSEPSNRASEAQAILQQLDKDGKPVYDHVVQDPSGQWRARRAADHTQVDVVNVTEHPGG